MVPRKNKKRKGNVAESTQSELPSEQKTPQSLKPEDKILKKSANQKSALKKRLEIAQDQVEDKGKRTNNDEKQVNNDRKRSNLAESTQQLVAYVKITPEKPENKIVKKSTNQNSAREKGVKITEVQGVDGEKTTNKKDNQVKKDNKRDVTNNKDNQVKKDSKRDVMKNLRGEEHTQKDHKAERNIGGLIFMCNRRTKSDCFSYRVMGVSASKQEVVMGIKPGLTLFLYDFDLRLLYGIYKASSVGGMKLEPAAFAGAFPAQVRFTVHKECLPLPESAFKKAIKDNYDEKTHKFKTELTVEQVKKLACLFKAAPSLHSDANSSLQKPLPNIYLPPPASGEEALAARSFKDHYISRNAAAEHHNPLGHEKKQMAEQYIQPDHVASSSPLFLSEKEYRSFGLRGERPNPTLRGPDSDPYRANREWEQPRRNPASLSRAEMLIPRGSTHSDELFLSEKDYRTYGLKGRNEVPQKSATVEYKPPLDSYRAETYNPYHDSTTSLVNQYLSLPPEPVDNMQWRETYANDSRWNPGRVASDERERLYSRYAYGALSDYNKEYHHLGDEPGSSSTPVSSRYSFAGPSLLYR